MKIKVRNGKYNRWSGEPIKFEEFEIECKGTGTKDDPVIIDMNA